MHKAEPDATSYNAVSPMVPLRRRQFAAMLFVTALAGQSGTTGALGGAVRDAGGAALPNVTVTLVSSATMATQTAVTAASGTYAFSLLAPGDYAVQFAAPGYKTGRMAAVTVNVGEAPTLDAALERGEGGRQPHCAPPRGRETKPVDGIDD